MKAKMLQLFYHYSSYEMYTGIAISNIGAFIRFASATSVFNKQWMNIFITNT